jgi:hypothetical protein
VVCDNGTRHAAILVSAGPNIETGVVQMKQGSMSRPAIRRPIAIDPGFDARLIITMCRSPMPTVLVDILDRSTNGRMIVSLTCEQYPQAGQESRVA